MPTMDDSERTLLIDDGRVVALRGRAGTRLRVLAGTVWLTEDGRRDDVVLRAGERATVLSPGLVLIEGIGRARLRLADAGAGSRVAGLVVRGARGALSAARRWRARTQLGPAADAIDA